MTSFESTPEFKTPPRRPRNSTPKAPPRMNKNRTRNLTKLQNSIVKKLVFDD